VHRIANVLDKLPTRLQRQAKRALYEIMYAEGRSAYETAMQRFAQDYETKYPKAVKALLADVPRLLTRFDFPAAHWKHIRSTNPIESTFGTVKAADASHQRGWLADCRVDDGVQTAPGRAGNLAPIECARPAPTRPRRRPVSRWSANGTTGAEAREERRKVAA
jgi:hypothetical protein